MYLRKGTGILPMPADAACRLRLTAAQGPRQSSGPSWPALFERPRQKRPHQSCRTASPAMQGKRRLARPQAVAPHGSFPCEAGEGGRRRDEGVLLIWLFTECAQDARRSAGAPVRR